MKAVAIIGPKNCYTKRKKVKEAISKLRNINPNIVILSGGNECGIEQDVKETAITYGLKYKEFNPAFTEHNDYSVMDKSYFNKKYHYSHIVKRYDMLLQNTDVLVVGYDDGSQIDPVYYKLLTIAQKKNKKIIFI